MQLPESNFRMAAMCRETGRVVVNPLLVRADVTFMRQDFSVRQSVYAPTAVIPENLRFDYLVRTRPARAEELALVRKAPPEKYEQREAVLFALRELTGQDAGPTTEAWLKLLPEAETLNQAARLGTALIRAIGSQKEHLIERYREADDAVYTRALALAIPKLKGDFRVRAREALTDRLSRDPDRLEAASQDQDVEIRQAAARARESIRVIQD